MDAVEFMKAEKRFLQECEDSNKYFDLKLQFHQFEECVALVKQWSQEHPIKTYKSEFLEKFPDALVDELCVENIFGCKHKLERCIDTKTFISYCNSCWHREFKGWS